MRMEAAIRTPRARNASFDHARRYAVITGQLFRGREPFGPRSEPFGHCLQFLHSGPNSAYPSSSQVGSPFRSAAERLQFGQSPVWSVPLAVEAEAAGRGHDDEAIMLRSATFASTGAIPF